MESILNISDITFGYNRKRGDVLSQFSLDLQKGAVYGLLGKNGTGKSTLLYLMCGLLRPQKGSVMMRGVDVALRHPSTLSGTYIVPEEFELPSVTLREFVRLNSSFYPRFSEEILQSCLSSFDMPSDIHLGQLSMGQKKKAYMSFALAANTPLLLMDEPSNGFDIPSKSQMRKVISSSMTDDRTIVISTHQVRDIENLLDRVVIIDGSHLLMDYSYGEILEKLRFEELPSSEPTDGALYVQPSLSGNSAVFANADGVESQMNLEVLFNAMLANRAELQNVLNSKI